MNLVRYKLWHDSYSKRLVAVCGDLERPLLGLKAAHFNVLAGQLDAIYHNGARVNNVETYARLKPANVFATAELLRLASQIRIKPLHFVSTIAIAADCAEPQLVREDHRFASSSLPPTGYVASKWVAEQLVWTASERGLPVTVHRPGRICGDTKSGVTGNDDAFWQLIKAMLELEAIPDLVHHENSFVDLIPVDHVARAIVHISRQPQSIGKAFHLTCEFISMLGSFSKSCAASAIAFRRCHTTGGLSGSKNAPVDRRSNPMGSSTLLLSANSFHAFSCAATFGSTGPIHRPPWQDVRLSRHP